MVQAPAPQNAPTISLPPFVQQGIKQIAPHLWQGPDPDKPYLRKRYLLPTPLENASREAIDAAGLDPSFRGHNHSPALEVCPNGDLLLVIYTSYREYEPEVSLIGSRLRFGADAWDMPSPLFDFPNVNDHAPLLWNDDSTLHLFWGNPYLEGAFPFQWTSSEDSGATWSEVKFPAFAGAVGPHSRQPINTAFRAADNTMYVASDAEGGTSVLWASRDNGQTWRDTGGRSAGRHTTFALLQDGRILGMGGKNTAIEGFMPRAISKDGGRTWEKSRTSFCCQTNNQRPCILRLQSGRLFFAGDFQTKREGFQPEGITQRGAYVALSEDEGETWHLRKLAGAQVHEDPGTAATMQGATLGYAVARQAPGGLVHLVTTMNHPCLHFELNEAWILAAETEEPADEELMRPIATAIAEVETFEETYSDGHPRAIWSGGVGDDGRYLLHGCETWFYENGQKQREATYRLGRKVGAEICWSPAGAKMWEWQYHDDHSRWTQWWPDGQKKAESTWRHFQCDGEATCWDRSGKILSRATFAKGELVERTE